MKKVFVLCLLIYAMLCVRAYAQPAPNEQQPVFRVAVIDIQAISRKAKAMQSVHKQLEKLRESYQNDIARQQEVLRNIEKELAEFRDRLSKEELAEKTRDFTKKAAFLQSQVEQTKDTLEAAYTEATRKFQTEVVRVVTEYTEEQDIDLVLRRSQVFLADRAMDITAVVLERIDRRLPEIPINIPKT